MAEKSHFLAPAIYQYLLDNSVRELPVLKELRRATSTLPGQHMILSPDQGQFFGLLIKLMQAHHTLDIGTFSGYSALTVALALPPTGHVITCDIDEYCTQMARRFWHKADVYDKITLKLAPALDTLDVLIRTKYTNYFDFIFIDADKANNDQYYEKSLQLLRPHGLIAIDNVLRRGRVIDRNDHSKTLTTLRAFNHKLSIDERVDISMLAIADGVTLACKKQPEIKSIT